MDEPLEVVIVGGVVAGWMTAAALVGLLSPTIRRVRLIEAAGTGAAVGATTLPGLRRINAALGLAEPKVMRRTEATFKLGTEFIDWGRDGSSYFQPFDAPGRPMGASPFTTNGRGRG